MSAVLPQSPLNQQVSSVTVARQAGARLWLRRHMATLLTVLAAAVVIGGLVRLAVDHRVASVASFQEP